MDNRRYARPQSRDTRRPTGSAGDDTPIEEIGAPEVELVELSPPREQRRYPANNVGLAILIVAMLAFGAGLAWPRGGSVAPGPSGGTAIGAGQTPGAQATVPASPVPPSGPSGTVGGAAPIPTSSPAPGEWLAYDLNLPGQTDPLGFWVVQNWFVLGTRQFVDNKGPLPSLLASTTGRVWRPITVPPAIAELQAGTVIDGRLWFIASVTAVAGSSYQLVSVTPSGDWTSMGPAQGLDIQTDMITALGHVADRWVAATYQYNPTSEGGGVIQELRSSSDGKHWTRQKLPDGAGAGIVSTFKLGDTLGLVWLDPNTESSAPLVFTTQDGERWTRSELTDGLIGGVGQVACSETRCAAYGYHDVGGVYLPMVSTSTDGIDWALTERDALPDLLNVVAMPDGFIALDTGGRRVWLSADGIEWRSVDVLPVGAQSFGMLATNSDYVASIGAREPPTDLGYQYVAWAGELDDLRP
jgi:hypothetical protein